MSRDLRKFARQTDVQLIAGGLLLLFVVGDGLIYYFYGLGSALFGLLCLAGGLVPIGLTYLALLLLDWIAKRARRE